MNAASITYEDRSITNGIDNKNYMGSWSVGAHNVSLYSAENCCNGGAGAWFSTSTGGAYQNLSVANLNAASPTPLPAALLFVAPALAGVFGFSRRKAAKGLNA